MTGRNILVYLARGGRHTAKEIFYNIGFFDGDWDTLVSLEREHLVYRAYTLDDWTTFQLWKITGCGAIHLQLRS